MAIRIFPDKIQIGSFNLYEGNGGIQFDGEAIATAFRQKGYQGDSYGYVSARGAAASNAIDRYPFAIDTNAVTQTAVLTQSRVNIAAGASSLTHGYNAAGQTPGGAQNTIDKFAFATDSNATDVGDTTVGTYGGGTGNSSKTHGYHTNGYYYINTIGKFSFITDGNATDVGDSTYVAMYTTNQSSSVSGYLSGGGSSPSAPTRNLNTINKFPFATDTNATDIADLAVGTESAAGTNSFENGYVSGGGNPTDTNVIEKFPFASNTNSTNIADLTQTRGTGAGASSRTHGYQAGGNTPGGASNTIDKFPFSSDSNATDVGDLAGTSSSRAGQVV